MRRFAILPALFLVTVAVADEPASRVVPAQSSSAATAAQSTSTSTPAQTISISTSTAATPGAQSDKVPVPALGVDDKQLLSEGYKISYVNGQKVFCRREHVLGSNLEKKVCGTAETLATSRQDSRDLTDRMQRNQINPHGQ